MKPLYLVLFTIFFSCHNVNNKKVEIMGKDTFILKDANGRHYKIQQLNKSDFLKYKEAGDLSLCEEIKRDYSVQSYMTKEGFVIVEESGNYAIYPSLDILKRILQNYKGPYHQEILYDINSWNEDFPIHAEELIFSLYKDLYIKPSTVHSLEELKKIDSHLEKRDGFILKDVYLKLIAMVGESLIYSFHNAKWKMTLCDDGKTWNPNIEINGKTVFFADYIREEFSDKTQKHPLQEVYETVCDIVRINIK